LVSLVATEFHLGALSVFSALLVALREGVEAALVVGIVLLYLARTGRRQLSRPVWVGLVLALVASAGAGELLARWQVNQDGFEGLLLVVAAVFVVSMVVWMNRVARHLRQEIERRVEGWSVRGGRWAALGVGGLVFLMVLREGVELVLILRAMEFSTQTLQLLLGTAAGLLLAALLGVSFFQGTLRVPLGRFFRATSVMLTVVAVQLLVTGLHEMSEAMWLPSSRTEMALVGPVVRNELFFFVLVLGTAALVTLREWIAARVATVEASREAERRLRQWELRRQRGWLLGSAAGALAALVLLTAEFLYARTAAAPPPAVRLPVQGMLVRVPLQALAGPPVHFFVAEAGGVERRFMVVRQSDGHLVAALDACQICGPAGYRVQGSNLICRNCASPTYLPSVGTAGGCNPIPLHAHLEGSELVVELTAPESAAHP
jgi:high-affinity iron transporter